MSVVSLPSLPGYKPKPGQRNIRIKQTPDDKTNDIIKNLPKHIPFPLSTLTDAAETRILSFVGYFDEQFNDAVRPRQCQLNYFMNTGEINVVMKPQGNSRIIPGTLVRRGEYFNDNGDKICPSDLNLDNPVVINGIVFNLTDCDYETREYLRRKDGDFDLNTSSVTSTMRMSLFDEWGRFHSKRNENKTFLEAMLGNSVNNSGREGFLRFGNNVLKFKLRKNDPSDDDIVVEFALVYYLADDTIEVFSMGDYNGNRNGFSKLLKRSKLPKHQEPLSITLTPADNSFYHWSEFTVGTVINVYNKHLRIVDTDSYTKSIYAQMELNLGAAESDETADFEFTQREVPPPTGFGSEEDSLRSCTGSLIARAPAVKSFGENKSYNFKAKLLNGGPDDADREFVITYYFSDKTIKVTEPPIRNSGFVGGVFLSRRTLKLPSGETLSDKNLYVGAKITLSRQVFLLLDADERTLRQMEEAGSDVSHIKSILLKLAPIASNIEDLRSLFHRVEEGAAGVASKDTLISALTAFRMLGEQSHQLCEHEIVTIIRAYGTDSNNRDLFNHVAFLDDLSYNRYEGNATD